MKRSLGPIVIGCIITPLLLACSATVRQKQAHYANKQLKEQWTEIRDTTNSYVRHGKYFSWYQTGQEQTTGEYNIGNKTGLWLTRYENGQVIEWHEYLDGQLDGLSVCYYLNREKKYEGKTSHGRRVGIWRKWYENGLLMEEAAYKDDRLHGISTVWFRTGQKKEESLFSNGVLDGPYTCWRESGLRHIEGRYRGGKKEGTWTTWDDMGIVVSVQEFVDGMLVNESKSDTPTTGSLE